MPKQTPKNVRSRSSSMTISMLYFHSVVDHCVQNSLRTPIHRTDISMHKSRRCVKAAENGRVYFATNFKAFSIYNTCIKMIRYVCRMYGSSVLVACVCLLFILLYFFAIAHLGTEKRDSADNMAQINQFSPKTYCFSCFHNSRNQFSKHTYEFYGLYVCARVVPINKYMFLCRARWVKT